MPASWLMQLTTYPVENCAPDVVNWWTRALGLSYYANLVVTIVLFGYGLRRRQAWAVWLGFGLTGSWVVSVAAQRLFRSPVPLATCVGGYAMPASEPQNMSFLVTAAALLTLQWYEPRFHYGYYVLGQLGIMLVTLAGVYYRFATPAQLLAGTALGPTLAFAWMLVYWLIVVPRLDSIVDSELVQRYYPLDDTLTRSYRPVRGSPPPAVGIADKRTQ